MARIHLFPDEATPENVLTPPGRPVPVGGPIQGHAAGPASVPAIPKQCRGPRCRVPAVPADGAVKNRRKRG